MILTKKHASGAQQKLNYKSNRTEYSRTVHFTNHSKTSRQFNSYFIRPQLTSTCTNTSRSNEPEPSDPFYQIQIQPNKNNNVFTGLVLLELNMLFPLNGSKVRYAPQWDKTA